MSDTPRKRLKLLRIELRYHQQMNRVAEMELRLGILKAKWLGAEMRKCQRELRSLSRT